MSKKYYWKNKFNNALKQKPVGFVIDKTDSNNDVDIKDLWKIYFHNEKYNESSIIIRKIDIFKKHFESNSLVYNYSDIINKSWFNIYFEVLLSDSKLLNSWSNFKQDLLKEPEMVLSCAAMAMHTLIINNMCTQESNLYLNNRNSLVQEITPRLHGFDSTMNVKSLRTDKCDQLVIIKGTVVGASTSEILCTWLTFQCIVCNTVQVIKQPKGVYTLPTSCKSPCKSRSNFIPLFSSTYTRIETFQTIRIQESILGLGGTGRIPTSIEAELSKDLVDLVYPGNDITLTGILKVKSQDEIQREEQAKLYKMYIQAISISNNKKERSDTCEFTAKDLELIKAISSEPDVFRLLVHSLCPIIYGHEMVKAGLILSLFEGSNSSSIPERTKIHVLIVGDPGIGKSHLLESCVNAAPRGIFVCGKSSSNAGLTVSIKQQRDGGVLEAGALILADQGVCCIDELDKMALNYQSLLEVMEQECVSVAKAGILCTLPARTTILAVANPKCGHYDKSKTVSENLKLSAALLSRFDLVFVLLDKPNSEKDKLLTSHIQNLYSRDQKCFFNWNSSKSEKENGSMNITKSQYQQLEDRLILLPNEKLDFLPPILLKSYIAYARRSIHPILSSEATEILKKFYLELRTLRVSTDTIPITIRQLESLIRLTEARARLDLSPVATVSHALDVLSIVKCSMSDVFSSETGELQFDRSINGSGISQLKQAKLFLNALQKRSLATQKTIFHLNELKELSNTISSITNFSQIIDSLNLQGVLLKKGNHFYKVIFE